MLGFCLNSPEELEIMTLNKPLQETLLPSFSIILETENLATAELQGLVHAISSLDQQTVSPPEAQEVILIDSGDTPPELLAQLQQQYPWIQIHQAPPEITYYQAKMLGASLATGEILVYYDADCLYEPHWLESILNTFAQNPDIQIVAGETTTQGATIYGTAMALVYIFPQFSGETAIAPTSQYFLNNVAFRRNLLLEQPIPTDVPLYRGNCVLHAYNLIQQGYTIWRQPNARTTHALPNGLSHFFWRFLLIGYDYYWQKQLLTERQITIPGSDSSLSGWSGKIGIFQSRIKRLFVNNPRHFINLPLALPIMLAALTLIGLGYGITLLNPKYLLAQVTSPSAEFEPS